MAGMYEIRSHALKSVESSPPFRITFSIKLETFYNSFQDENDHENEIFTILRSPVSFWRENAVAVVNLLRVVALETSHEMLEVLSFCDRVRT